MRHLRAPARTLKPMRLLITGVPGTGKTTVAGHLAGMLGCQHLDMEAAGFRVRADLAADQDQFLRRLPRSVVASWGFGPLIDRRAVEALRGAGFRAVWLDGDRVASFREFMRREHSDPAMECDYYRQMQMVIATGIAATMDITVCPFRAGGSFRPVGDIAEDILNAAATAAARQVTASRPARKVTQSNVGQDDLSNAE